MPRNLAHTVQRLDTPEAHQFDQSTCKLVTLQKCCQTSQTPVKGAWPVLAGVRFSQLYALGDGEWQRELLTEDL